MSRSYIDIVYWQLPSKKMSFGATIDNNFCTGGRWAANPRSPLCHTLPQRLPKSSWRDVRYKGDTLTRPIASFELGFLVRLLVALSMRLNAWLALDRPRAPGEEPPEKRMQVGRRSRWGGWGGGQGRVGGQGGALSLGACAWAGPGGWLAGHMAGA